jgi:hypothetical protein
MFVVYNSSILRTSGLYFTFKVIMYNVNKSVDRRKDMSPEGGKICKAKMPNF